MAILGLIIALWPGLCCGCGGTQSSSSGYPTSDGEPIATGEPAETLHGRASYYSDRLAGNTTANGEIYDPDKYTAASRTLPFGTVVRVTRVDNGKQVVVRINDRGPFRDKSRILDLSRRAAEELDMIRAGVVDIKAEVMAAD